MNKFFRLVSMFAIAGVTFAYTSCTDYSEDINKANERIDNLETGRLKTVEDQVATLKTTVTSLETAQAKAEASITELQTALKALQDKHAEDIAKLEKDYAAADAALKSEIQSKIDALTKTHADDVKTLTASIDALKADVKTLQDKAAKVEEVLPTLATKTDLEKVSKEVADQIKTINTTIGTLQGNLDVAQKNITALQEKMTKAEEDIASMKGDIANLQTAVKNAQTAADNAQKAAEAAQTAADNAQKDATSALGEIESLKEALKSYATIAALDAVVEQLEKMDSTLQADKFNTADFDTTFATNLKEVIGAYAKKGVLEDKLTALGSKDEELADEISKVAEDLAKAEEALNGKISALDTKVEKYKKEVDDRIDSVLGIIAGRLSSIAFVPQYYYDGVPAILFETIAYNPLAADKENEVATVVTGDNEENNSEYANLYKNFTSALATAKYRLNPRTVGADCADFSFVGDKADYVHTRATAPAAPVSIEGTPEYDAKTGYVTFSVKKNEKLNVTANENKNLDIVALKAVLKQGLTDAEAAAKDKPEVYSEYAHVNEIAYSAANLAISDSLNLATKSVKRAKSINGHEYAKTFKAATEQDPVYDMPYNKVFNLRELIATCINTKITTAGLEGSQDHIQLDLAKYDHLEYKFSVAKTDYYIQSEDTKTNQQSVIECTDAKNGLFKVVAAQGVEYNKEAIGRTPIVRVDLMHNGNIVTRAFIKLIITVEKEKDILVKESDKPKSITLACPDTKVGFEFSEERLREEIYRVFNISHEEFWNIYQFGSTEVTVNGKKNDAFTQPVLESGVSTDGKATKKITWNFTHKEVGAIGAGKAVVGKLTLTNKLASSALPLNITFVFEANFSLPAVSIDVTRNEILWKDDMYQVNVNVPEAVDSDASKCQFNNAMYTANAIGEQAWKKFVVKNVPCNETGAFVIVNVVENGKTIAYDKSSKGVKLETIGNVTYIKLDKTNAAVKAALNSAKGLQAELKYKITYTSGDVVYPAEGDVVVNFIKPLNLNLPEGLSVKDAVTGGDKVDFDHRDLLTDWRGEDVLKDVEVPGIKNWYEWVKVCGKDGKHEKQYIPETQVVKTPAKLDVEYQTITIKTGNVYFSATIQLYNRSNYFDDWKKYSAFTAKGRSASEAIENALTIARTSESNGEYFDGRDVKYKYEVENVKEDTASSTIEFESVKSVNYTPAVYEIVPGYWKYADCTAAPTENGDYAGQVKGCYEWTLKTAPVTEVVPGQYWNYYGPISDVVLDLAKVSTNLPDKKLPAKASLTQTGTTVTYNNVESPINHDYEIYIPAKVTYGWGTLTGTLTITVNPVSTIK